ncbi:MAG: transporter permease [Patescibacteria group bacterium]|nr:transporter permease [Patescibacteria group bacterium]
MKYRDIIRTANSNLRKSKLRTFLTIGAVFMGALTLMLTTGVGQGLKTYVDEQVSAVGAKDALIISVKTEGGGPVSNDNPKDYDPSKKQASADFTNPPMLSAEDVAKIEKTEGIKSVQLFYPVAAEYITRQGQGKFLITATQAVDGLNQPLSAGKLVDNSSDTSQITIPPAFVGKLGFSNDQDAVNKKVAMAFKDSQGQIFEIPVTVVGVQEKTLIQGNAANVNDATMLAAFNRATAGVPDFQRNQYAYVVGKFDVNMSETDLKALKDRLAEQGYSASTLEDQLGIINNVINVITVFLAVFAGIALAAASFGIVNTLFMSVQERTREIGLMKALGMGRRKIFALFSLEAILIGFWGALIALGAANIIGRIGSKVAANTLFKDFEGLELFSFPTRAMIPIIILIIVIAFLAGALPARRASRKDPIEALRYE